MSDNQKTGYAVMFLIAIVAAALVFAVMQPNDDPGEKLGQAIEDAADSLGDAAKELDPNRTAGEKFGDAVEDMGESIQDASHQ